MKKVITSRIIIGIPHLEAILRKELAIPKNAKMKTITKSFGDHFNNTYKEELSSISFEWKEES
jgi:hypothetical protein